jgi:hypothetical protein
VLEEAERADGTSKVAACINGHWHLDHARVITRVFQAIEPTAFAECIAAHLARLGFVIQGGQIAIDGKALRGSRSGESTHLHAVGAWAREAGITLARAFVGEKTNGITAIPKLLEMLTMRLSANNTCGTAADGTFRVVFSDGLATLGAGNEHGNPI